jgi:hypothetical protein
MLKNIKKHLNLKKSTLKNSNKPWFFNCCEPHLEKVFIDNNSASKKLKIKETVMAEFSSILGVDYNPEEVAKVDIRVGDAKKVAPGIYDAVIESAVRVTFDSGAKVIKWVFKIPSEDNAKVYKDSWVVGKDGKASPYGIADLENVAKATGLAAAAWNPVELDGDKKVEYKGLAGKPVKLIVDLIKETYPDGGEYIKNEVKTIVGADCLDRNGKNKCTEFEEAISKRTTEDKIKVVKKRANNNTTASSTKPTTATEQDAAAML